jgi:hypothetical protein
MLPCVEFHKLLRDWLVGRWAVMVLSAQEPQSRECVSKWVLSLRLPAKETLCSR